MSELSLGFMSERVEVSDLDELQDLFMSRNWSDGLPVMPPTPERVALMFEYMDYRPDHSLGAMPPSLGELTMEKIAINAVMAGCKPAYMPFLVAAVQAIMQEQFNLNGVQTTAHPCSPLLVYSGPLTRKVGLNDGHNLFGPGWRPNATIGRALNLIRLTVGGAIPKLVDKATHGHPGKYTYCIAENIDDSPWESLAVTYGYQASDTIVAAYAAEGPRRVVDQGDGGPGAILRTTADSMAVLGTNKLYWTRGEYLVVLNPDHAKFLAAKGYSKFDVQVALFEQARRSIREITEPFGSSGLFKMQSWPDWVNPADPEQRVPVVQRPEDIVVLMAGGHSNSFAIIPTWGAADKGVSLVTAQPAAIQPS